MRARDTVRSVFIFFRVKVLNNRSTFFKTVNNLSTACKLFAFSKIFGNIKDFGYKNGVVYISTALIVTIIKKNKNIYSIIRAKADALCSKEKI